MRGDWYVLSLRRPDQRNSLHTLKAARLIRAGAAILHINFGAVRKIPH